ncbi:MAG: putative lipase [Symbiobacteriaceae bacterium]|jgi:acetyl esterase/lipase|nr:putative lipase [Symbiobacteriaceae bacterium]
MIVAATVFAVALLAFTSLLYIRLHVPSGGIFLTMFKALAGAFSLGIAAVGLAGTVAGDLLDAPLVQIAYGLLTLSVGYPLVRIMTTQDVLSPIFGSVWPAEEASGGKYALRRQWGFHLGRVPAPRHQSDIPCGTPPERGRPLLCDIWQPGVGVQPSGLGFIYFHGSAWTILDKDYMTRTLFRHLTAQGHVVMDVAYRLYPETDIEGMVADVRRSVAWLKANAAAYGVNPDRIVIGGASAGAHISLLAAYTEGNPDLTPPDLCGVDTSVRGVLSWYGPVDLAACYQHYEIEKMAAQMPERPDWSAPIAPTMRRMFGKDAERLGLHKANGSGRLDWICGGSPAQVPGRYALLSPVTHIHPGCPPTLLMQGEHDLIVPAAATREVDAKLRQAGVKAACLVLPQTDHAFDLFAMNWSPASRVALWHAERFLALMAQ